MGDMPSEADDQSESDKFIESSFKGSKVDDCKFCRDDKRGLSVEQQDTFGRQQSVPQPELKQKAPGMTKESRRLTMKPGAIPITSQTVRVKKTYSLALKNTN